MAVQNIGHWDNRFMKRNTKPKKKGYDSFNIPLYFFCKLHPLLFKPFDCSVFKLPLLLAVLVLPQHQPLSPWHNPTSHLLRKKTLKFTNQKNIGMSGTETSNRDSNSESPGQSVQRPWLISQALAQGLFRDAPSSYPANPISRHVNPRLPPWVELQTSNQDSSNVS